MEQKGPAIAYYITPHGFGHAVRSLEILRRLTELDADVRPVIISDIPYSLIEQNVGKPLQMRRVRLDIGLFQHDSIRFDLDRTLHALSCLHRDAAEIIEKESAFLREEKIGAVVSDVAFLPFEAADECGVPSIGISNFTWDWIYGEYARDDSRWNEIISWIRRAYSKCGLFLQLPMHGDCSVCPNLEEVALVARKALLPRNEVRALLGLGDSERVILVAFSSLDLDGEALRRLQRINDVTFLYKSPTAFPLRGARTLDASGVSYVDAVAASDAVITKPGYGIVSDCLANGTPIIYTDRGPFPEYDVLVGTIRKELANVYIDSRDFLAGNWETAIRQIFSIPRKIPTIRIDGADQCARKILKLVG